MTEDVETTLAFIDDEVSPEAAKILGTHITQQDTAMREMARWIKSEKGLCCLCQEMHKKPCAADAPTLGCRNPTIEDIIVHFMGEKG